MSYGDYDDFDGAAFRIGLYVGRPEKDSTGIRNPRTGWYKPVDTLYTRCSQADVWTDSSGITWDLEAMTPIHRRNLISWLERRAEALHRFAFENGKLSYQDRGLTADEWFATLPLVKALHDLTYCPTCGHAV